MERLITVYVPADAYLYRLFRPEGGWMMSVVPGLIVFVLFWTLTDLVLKFRVGRANERDLERPEVRQLPTLVGQEANSVTLQRLRGWDRGVLARPVGRRVLWLLHHLDTTDTQRAHELMRHQSDLDADSAASGYRTVKLFIWAMPILGFIGTVLGISLAVGGFSDFLTTNVSIDQIDQVTAELGEVASGLSFAFDTTLLGLLAGLVASVAISGVQEREERLLTGLDDLGLRILAHATPTTASASASRAHPQGVPAEEFDQMMRARLEELSGQMEQFTQAVRSGLDGFLGEWAKLPPEVEKVAADLTGLRQHLAAAAGSTEELISETRVLMEGLNEATSRMSSGLATSIGSVGHTVEGLGDDLQGVSDTLARSLAGLSDRVVSSESHLRSGLASLKEAIDMSHQDSAAAVQSQAAAEQAMSSLSASISEFGERLSEFKDAQTALAPVLRRLAGPLELRLMPTPNPERGAPAGGAGPPPTTDDKA
jgi:biopolymer transport protein ExbB/TolQ/uncharacterized protein YoxC